MGTTGHGERRRVDSRTEHVWTCTRSVGGRLLERVVGRGASLSCNYTCPETPSTQVSRDERWNNIPLCPRRDPLRAATCKGCCEGEGCTDRRRCRDDSTVSPREAHRRTASRVSPDPYGLW